MPMRVPPPEIPIVSFLTPNKADQGLLEFWNTTLSSYVPLDIGAPHPNTRLYPNFRLGRQAPAQGDEKWVLRTWVTDETSPDWFNWSGKFSDEDDEFPIFIRTYREPRSTYAPRTKAEPLSTLYKLVLTDNGSGYAVGALPNVVFDDPTVPPTSVAIAHGIVGADGSITECTLDFCGDGYAQKVAFHVEDPVSGTPAKGIAYVQPQSAILVKEEAGFYPEDSEFYGLYLKVARVYETIPGPTLASTKLDVDGGTVTTSTTRKLCSSIATGEAINTGVWCRTTKKETDIDFICEEVVECRAIPGNPQVSTKIDPDGIPVTASKTYTATASCVSSETLAAGVWTVKYIENLDGSELVSWQWIATRAIPGNAMTVTSVEEDGKTKTTTRTLQDQTAIITDEAIIGGVTWRRRFQEDPPVFRGFEIKVGDKVAWQIVESRPIPGNFVDSTRFRSDGSPILVAKRLQDTTAIVPGGNISGGLLTLIRIGEVSDLVSEEIKEVSLVPGPTIHGEHVDERTGIIIDIEKTIVPDGTEGGLIGGAYVEIKPHDEWQAIQLSSKFDATSLPEDVQWFSGQAHSFPPELQAGAIIDWAEAVCGCSDSFSAVLIANMKQYAGPVKTRITEQFYNGPPPDDVTITQFFPQSHSFGFAWASACGSTDGNCRTKSGAPKFYIPLCLHNDISFTIGALPAFVFPATTPAALPHGSYIMLPPRVERRAFGVYRRILTEVLVP